MEPGGTIKRGQQTVEARLLLAYTGRTQFARIIRRALGVHQAPLVTASPRQETCLFIRIQGSRGREIIPADAATRSRFPAGWRHSHRRQ